VLLPDAPEPHPAAPPPAEPSPAELAAALARLKTVLDQAVRETFAPAPLPW